MQQNERHMSVEVRQRIATREGKTQRQPHHRAERFCELEITLDSMRAAIDSCDVIVKETRSFAAVAHPVNFPRSAQTCDESTAKQALEIEHHVGPKCSRIGQPWQQPMRCAPGAEFA